ncbi:MAG TPA: hypothetical protein VGF92_04725 [Stellaceae bacterium]|jgi:hypothetical protein
MMVLSDFRYSPHRADRVGVAASRAIDKAKPRILLVGNRKFKRGRCLRWNFAAEELISLP